MKKTMFIVWALVAGCLHAEQTPENQALDLRARIEKTTDVAQRKELLQQMAETGTFQTWAYAQQLKADKQLKGAAKKAAKKVLKQHPEYKDFTSIFNGKDLTGWKGLVENPIKRRQMSDAELEKAQVKADEIMRRDWTVQDGTLTYVGHGFENICTAKDYKDLELYVEWRLDPNGAEPDAGVYLRGTPQVQIWDIARVNVGAQVGSGGLYNNQKHRSTPTQVADRKLGEWNAFRIRMVGEKVSVWLNGIKVVDEVVMENYWDRSQPIPACDQIEMQAHGSLVNFRNIYVKEL